MIKPIYEQLAQQYQGKAILVKADVDGRADIIQQFWISFMPTFIAFVGGKVKDKMKEPTSRVLSNNNKVRSKVILRQSKLRFDI